MCNYRLFAAVLLLSCVAHGSDLKTARDTIEASYKSDLAVCMEFDKSEQPTCKQEAQVQRQSNYQSLWDKRDPKAPAPVYTGDSASQKKQIEADYQLMQSVCKELNKATQPNCKTEAMNRKKTALKTAMNAPAKPVATELCQTCGVVSKVAVVDQPGEGTWMGTIGGAVVGGGLGSLVGKGTGKTVAVIAGALGGGYAGNKIEGKMNDKKYYEVTVKLDDGTTQSVTFDHPDHGFKEGDKVRLDNKQLVKR